MTTVKFELSGKEARDARFKGDYSAVSHLFNRHGAKDAAPMFPNIKSMCLVSARMFTVETQNDQAADALIRDMKNVKAVRSAQVSR